jgi:hypothetical protein
LDVPGVGVVPVPLVPPAVELLPVPPPQPIQSSRRKKKA